MNHHISEWLYCFIDILYKPDGDTDEYPESHSTYVLRDLILDYDLYEDMERMEFLMKVNYTNLYKRHNHDTQNN